MKTELERKYRVVDMMITMHSILKYRNNMKNIIAKIFFLVTAIILNYFTFFDYTYLAPLNIDVSDAELILKITSFLIFLLSIVYLQIEWSKKVEGHSQAINLLSRLLNELRIIIKLEDKNLMCSRIETFNELYSQTFESISSIPNNKFNKLKTKHYQKVELSKFIDIHKGKPYWVIKLLFYIEQLRIKKQKDEKN